MEKYYLIVDQSSAKTCQPIKHSPKPIKHSPKPINPIKPIRAVDINKYDSPKTLRKNISNENFIKFQWAWVL